MLALQGGFEAHGVVLRRLGAQVREIRTVADLDGLDGLVIPGGESTTMTLGIEREGLAGPLRELVLGETGMPVNGRRPPASADRGSQRSSIGGVPVLGTCAGLIMLDREHLGLMDIEAQRNAFGRQSHSFEVDLDVRGLGGSGGERDGAGTLRAVFIRAPWIAAHGPDVEILAEVDGHPVAARQGRILAVAFHAELTGDERLHRLFLELIEARDGAQAA